MEQYKFPLQKLLDLRIDKEEQSKRSFMEAQRDKEIVEQRLKGLQQSYDKYKHVNKGDGIIEQKIRINYLNALTVGVREASGELERKTAIVEENRTDLMKRQVERKTVETLKDKKLEAFITEQNRIEQNNNDEFALYSYIRATGRR
jgi:flagellar protein FliJ